MHVTRLHWMLGSLVVMVGVALSAGCGSTRGGDAPDKAGGSTRPTVLRLAAADNPDVWESRAAKRFAEEVRALSEGRLTVEVTFSAAGEAEPDYEARTIELVRTGRFDLGWVPTRAWGGIGVTGFDALQAPFLITNYALLHRVLRSPLANDMLARLRRQRLVGIGLYPGLIRHPIGFHRPLVTPAELANARINVRPSRVTDALLRSLRAVPVHLGDAARQAAIAQGRLDGTELSIASAAVGSVVSANISLFPKVLVLFAGDRALARLSDEQRRVVHEAARRTLRGMTTHRLDAELGFESELVREFCATPGQPGRVALATDHDLAVLHHAARPVYAMLQRDSFTRSAIARIRAIGASLPVAPRVSAPPSCLLARHVRTTRGTPLPPSVLNGTYRWELSKTGAQAAGFYDPNEHYPIVNTAVLEDGRWEFPGPGGSGPSDTGTYRIVGDRIVFTWPSQGYDNTFRFVRDAEGTLHLTPVPPMDLGDQFVWAGGGESPWYRVGPPRKLSP